MTKDADSRTGQIEWFKTRKRELLAHVRALDDFMTAHALITRLVEDTDSEHDVGEQLRGALYMGAVVTYARQFLHKTTKYKERSVYPTRHLKADARFQMKIHSHLIDVRNKLIAHDDGEQLPPELLILQVSINEAVEEDTKPLLATLRSYSLSSAKGLGFLKSLQAHLESCVDTVRTTMHEGLLHYLEQANEYPQANLASNESKTGTKLRNSFSVPAKQPNEVTQLFKLDELNAQTISVPQGNVHNKAYTYRMITYSAALSSADFKVRSSDVKVFMGNRPPVTGSVPRNWMPRWLRRILDWGKKPFTFDPTLPK